MLKRTARRFYFNMKNILPLILVFSMTLQTLAQAQTPEPALHFPIRNTRSAQHAYVPGTRLYIIPPKGYTPSQTVAGFEKGGNSALVIQDLVGGSFYTNAATFSRQAFEQKGAKVFDYKETTIGGFPAKFLHAQGDANAQVIILVFGDSTFSTMIMAAYPAGDTRSAEDLAAALNTIVYDKNKKINPIETAIFTLDEKVSRFRFFSYTANLYMYSVGGKDNSADQRAPMALITQLPAGGGVTEKNMAEQMISSAQQHGLSEAKIVSGSATTINGLPAYEMTVSGIQNGEKVIYYECALSKGGRALSLTGVSYNDDQVVREFTALAHTLRFK
ncbi:MAG TPA: hypothetical protein VI233_00025 [Puia sp.]